MNLFGSITAGGWRRPEIVLLLMTAASAMSFATWMALLNNFAIERASFTGAEMGILQSIREIPGFLSFAVVFLLLLVREQALALLSLAVLGIGIAMTGFFPTILGLYLTTVIMSLGYHYYETVQASLSLQWISKKDAPQALGRIIAANSFAGLVAFALVYAAFDLAGLDFKWVYLLGGCITVAAVFFVWLAFPRFPQAVEQNKHMVLRRRYWLYYLLTFMAGARRQIFIVFAGFLMVEKFGYSVGEITLLFLLNGALNVIFAPRIGRLIGRWGERRALTAEYIGLIAVFTGYAFVENANIAAGLYVIDHLFFAMAIAIKTYFQKIADPADIAPTAGVGFTINHAAAVVIPAAFGFLWLVSPAAVFLAGSAMAAASLVLARLIPPAPAPGNEAVFSRARAVAAAE